MMEAGARELIVAEYRITGLSPRVVAELVAEVGPLWHERHQARLTARPRRRVGAGAKHEFVFIDRLLATLVSLRHGTTHDVLACRFGVDRSTVTRSIGEVRPLLAQRDAVLLVLDWRLGAAALAAMAPICWTMRSFRARSLQVYHRRSTAAGAAAGDMSETFAGIRTVQAFGREDVNGRRFTRLNGRHRKENRQAELEMARYVTSSRLVANIAVAGLALWGGYRVATRWSWARTPAPCCTCGICTTNHSDSAASSASTRQRRRHWANSQCCWPSSRPSSNLPVPFPSPRSADTPPDVNCATRTSPSPTATGLRYCAA
ncbi:transposase family protein [Streptomyces aurantiogriseus]|uniref:transposase family protein n=1 Tax=Streptomyces aurantiogriseus TaxID=66870 RepID=UPI001672F65F|nr:transposase family protein [Streptomyces aurantiogriseus]